MQYLLYHLGRQGYVCGVVAQVYLAYVGALQTGVFGKEAYYVAARYLFLAAALIYRVTADLRMGSEAVPVGL